MEAEQALDHMGTTFDHLDAVSERVEAGAAAAQVLYDRIQARLANDRVAFDGSVAAIEVQLAQARAELIARTDALVDRLSGLRQELSAKHAAAVQALSAARGEIEDLGEGIGQVSAKLNDVADDTSGHLGTTAAHATALARDCEERSGELAHDLGEVGPNELDACQQALVEHRSALSTQLEERLPAKLDEASNALWQQSEQHLQRVGTQFTKSGSETKDKAQSVVEATRTRTDVSLGNLATRARGSTELHRTIGNAISDTATTIDGAQNVTAESVRAATAGLQAALGVVQELQRLFAQF